MTQVMTLLKLVTYLSVHTNGNIQIIEAELE